MKTIHVKLANLFGHRTKPEWKGKLTKTGESYNVTESFVKPDLKNVDNKYKKPPTSVQSVW